MSENILPGKSTESVVRKLEEEGESNGIRQD